MKLTNVLIPCLLSLSFAAQAGSSFHPVKVSYDEILNTTAVGIAILAGQTCSKIRAQVDSNISYYISEDANFDYFWSSESIINLRAGNAEEADAKVVSGWLADFAAGDDLKKEVTNFRLTSTHKDILRLHIKKVALGKAKPTECK